MAETKSRKPVFQDYYTNEDYDDVLAQLPDIIKEAERKAGEVLEPTVYEKREIMATVREYIQDKKRKVYGGTALNEALKAVNPEDAIYDDYIFSDIEFYSPIPVPDLVELTNKLHKKGYKYVVGREAQHEETYSIFVNFQLYCDITYVPVRVYNGIKTFEIEGINYVDPHFMLIDYFRMINQPLTAASQRWEKAFVRMYKLLKNYPLEYFDKPIKIPKPTDEIQTYFTKIKTQFMSIAEVQESCLISGFDAYNFYIRHAASDRTVEQMARVTLGANRLDNFTTNIPVVDLISVTYRDTVERLYNFVKEIVVDPKEVTIEEYFPLFQFINYSATINYKGIPLARVCESDGMCVPNIKTTRGYMYVSYQYLLMTMLMNKLKAHLDKDREMYFNCGIAISNLVTARNVFLTKKNLGVINNTVFGEFRVSCVGTTNSSMRDSQLRTMAKHKAGKMPFRYSPEQFLSSSSESQAKFDPSRCFFRNTSGNKIINPKNLYFGLDEKGNIRKDIKTDVPCSEDENESINSLKSNERSDDTTSDSANVRSIVNPVFAATDSSYEVPF